MSTIEIKMTVDIEMEYDSFNGRTPEELSELIHDDIVDAIWELSGQKIEALYTDIKDVKILNDLPAGAI